MKLKLLKLSRNMRRFIFIFTFILLIAIILFSVVGFVNKNSAGTVRTIVAGLYIDDLNKYEARQILEQKVEEYKNSNFLITTTAGDKLKISPKLIGLNFDTDATLENAYRYGKEGNLLKKTLEQTRAFLFKKEVPLDVSFDNVILVHFIGDTLSTIYSPAKNASFIYNFDMQEFQFSKAKEGRIVNLDTLQNNILKNASTLSSADIYLTQQIDKPLVYEEGAEQAKQFAQKIIESGPYTIETRQTSWDVEQEDLIGWIEFKPVYNEIKKIYELRAEISKVKTQDYLISFAPGLNTPPVNAEFRMENNRVVSFNLATLGYELDIKKSANKISEAIENLEKNISLEFIKTEPAISQKSIQNLGIDSLLGVGESDFARSPNPRKHNIKVGSDKFQGLLIASGEEFSFNKNLGSVTGAEGYLPELVIKQGATVPEYGGGLCQVSTTLFRAAMYAGLEITKRSNHSYPVIYYGTPGFDATIYPPNPDLAFRNNTAGPILIQYKIEGTRLIFEIYGQDDGHQTEIVGPVTYDAKPDGSIKAWVKQIVKNEDEDVLFEKTFYSNYRSPKLYPINRNPLE